MTKWPSSLTEIGRKTRAVLVAVVFASGFALPAGAAEGEIAARPIYEHILLHLDARTGRIVPDGMTLPDESAARRFSRLRWVAGALEGLGTRHVQWDGSAKAAQAIALLEGVAAGDPTAEPVLYELLRADDVVTFYNDALDLASSRVRDAEPRLHDLARRLATKSTDRGPVKFGIAMLGSMGDESDLDIVRTLALHDEFGLYAAEAIAELAPERQKALYEMARQVSGWGRIEAVSLMTSTPDLGLRLWLVMEGFRNDVTPQYLAYHCATIADLAGLLTEQGVLRDTRMLAGVADLLQSLVKPGASKNSLTYADTAKSAIEFLELVQSRRESLSYLLAAQALSEHAPDSTWEPDQKAAVIRLAARVINDKGWHKRVVAEVNDDLANLEQAETAARRLDIETFGLHMRRLGKNGAVAERWTLAFAAAEPRQLRSLLEVAERTFGPRFAKGAVNRANTSDEALEAVLNGVAKTPGSGIPIIDASLLDVSANVRRAAVEALVRWRGAFLHDASVRAALTAAVQEEPDEALKARMVALLNVGAPP